MLINHRMHGSMIIATPCARLEWTPSPLPERYLQGDRARYCQSSLSDGWWQRTFALDPAHWLRLRGTPQITPSAAFRAILMEGDRPPLSFPVLILAMFLAHTAAPDRMEHHHAVRWVAAALPEMLTYIPVDPLCSGWAELSPACLDDMIEVVIDAMLHPGLIVPWAFQDGVWFQVLAHLADALWQFPPDAIRQIVSAATLQQESGLMDGDTKTMPGWAVLGCLSAIRFWREPWPRLRSLPIQTSLHDFLQLWQQALVIMYPTAPAITDASLAWLCDGTLGGPYDGPFDRLRATSPDAAAFNLSPLGWQKHIARLRNEAAQGSCQPSGCWEMAVSSRWSVLVAYGVRTMRLVAGSAGCWVRLIPMEESWGSVLWWQPDYHPPTCWFLALGQALSDVSMLALHATFWQLWRDLRVHGDTWHIDIDHSKHDVKFHGLPLEDVREQ